MTSSQPSTMKYSLQLATSTTRGLESSQEQNMSQPQQQSLQQQSPSPPSSSHSSQLSELSEGSMNEGEAVRRVTLMELTWEEAVSASILPVRCKDTNGELHKDKFGSGGKGKSIKSGEFWFTPSEFESFCGRGNSKDWRRSIRFGGRTLQTVIDKGFLIPHAAACICSACMTDSEATGPVRPYVPYQRRRKNQQGDEAATLTTFKLGRYTFTSADSATDDSSDVATVVTACGITPSMNPLNESLLKIQQASSPPTTEEAWKNLEDMVGKLAESALLMKHMVKDMKERAAQETESLRSQLQEKESLQNLYRLATVAQTQQAQPTPISGDRIHCNVIESPQILGILQSGGIQTFSFELYDSESLSQLEATQETPSTAKIEP